VDVLLPLGRTATRRSRCSCARWAHRRPRARRPPCRADAASDVRAARRFARRAAAADRPAASVSPAGRLALDLRRRAGALAWNDREEFALVLSGLTRPRLPVRGVAAALARTG
jgi:hypothetical protein